MTALAVTADANVLASGALRLRDDAAPVRLLRAWQDGRLALILSEPLIDEVERTLSKLYFAQRLDQADRDAYVALLRGRATVTPLVVPVVSVATHPEDDMVLATAVSGGATFLITGDHRLLDP